MKKIIFLCLLFSFGIAHSPLVAQELNWVYLPEEDSHGSCTSTSHPIQSIACFGLEYTPGLTGTITSYTFGYLVECNQGLNSINNTGSCIMVDNSDIFDGCSSEGILLLSASGNSGATSVIAGEPIIVHQVCLNLGLGDTLDITADDITGATVSLDLPGGGAATDDLTVPSVLEVNDGVFGIAPCPVTTSCSRSMGDNAGLATFELNGNGNILDAASDTSLSMTISYDFFDEVNEICDFPGGDDDVEISMQLVTTTDQYGGGVLNTMAGVGHRLKQNSNALQLEIPFGSDANSVSSTGDVRGATMEVIFASHIEVLAGQLSVDLSSLNSSSVVFSSAAIVFLDFNGNPFSTVTYNGYYDSGADLSGTCMSAALSTAPWSSSGTEGVFIIDNHMSTNVTAACNPVPGSSGIDTVTVHARLDAGLDSTTIVQGFQIYLYAEDVAAPTVLDDGSNTGGEDDVAGNAPTTTNSLATSSVLGFKIDGCVFAQVALPVRLISFDAQLVDSGVELSWATATEVNHSHFDIEWSSTTSDFRHVGTVKEPSEYEAAKHYQFKHGHPIQGANYYRLKQVDYDGSVEYSDIKKVEVSSGIAKQTEVYPNPAYDYISINLNRVWDYPLEVKIVDVNGNEVLRQYIDRGTSSHDIDMKALPSGTFILLIDNTAHKVVKLE